MRPARSEFLVTGPYHPRGTAPVVVLAGTRGSGKKALVGAVLGNSPPVPDTAWVVHRHAATPASRAYLPGSGEPQLTTGPPGSPSAGLARPPRRIELDHRVELLRRLTLVDTPEVDTLDSAYTEVTLDTAGPHGPARLPDTLDRELHALSVRLTNGLESAGRGVVDHVLRAALGHPPDADARARAATAIRQARAAAPPDGSSLDEVLLLASTAVVTTLRGTRALAALSAGPPTESPTVVRPVGIAVTAGCYALWRGRGGVDRTEASTWMERAIDSIAACLLDQTLSRLTELHHAIPAAVAAATDISPPGTGRSPAAAGTAPSGPGQVRARALT